MKLTKLQLREIIREDLRKWFGKGKTGSTSGGGWDRYNLKGEKVGKCGDAEEGEPYVACLSKEKADKLGPKGRASFVRRKREAQKKAGDAKKGGEQSKGQKPTLVKTKANEMKINLEEKLTLFLEKNVPTDSSKWSYAKSQAKQKFDVYPSAYANAWAAKKYKELGGGWRKEESLVNEDNPCWKGYQQIGTKVKNGKEVPNCVPMKEVKKLENIIREILNETLYKEPLGNLLKKKFPTVKFVWNNDSKGYWTTDNKFVDKYSIHRTNVNHSARQALKKSMNGLVINDDFDKIEITID